MRRYYLHKHKRNTYPNEQYDDYIIRYSPNEVISISENVNMPSITVDLDRMKNKGYGQPSSDDYNKYKKIDKEDFYNYLSVTLDAFKTFKSAESEIYFDKPYQSRYVIVQFSTNPKNKFRYMIEVNFDLEWGEVEMYCDRSFSRRKHYRENATPISYEQFVFLQFKTLEYFSDDLNYLKNFKEYLKVVDLSYKGKLKPEAQTSELDINPLITELSNQIRELETRLLNNDTDKRATREKMRGRIEGLKTAIMEINHFFAGISEKKNL